MAGVMGTMPSQTLDSFPNPKPERDYLSPLRDAGVHLPLSRPVNPIFATVRVEYVPDQLCVELKSWKLYLWSYRNQGAFHEPSSTGILDGPGGGGIVHPRRARVEGDFNIRGGLHTNRGC